MALLRVYAFPMMSNLMASSPTSIDVTSFVIVLRFVAFTSSGTGSLLPSTGTSAIVITGDLLPLVLSLLPVFTGTVCEFSSLSS